MRARIVLLAAEGLSNRAIAGRLGISGHTVRLWRVRYLTGGAAALERDAPGRGRRAANRAEATARVTALLRTTREDGRPWTVRSLASASGLSRATVDRIRRSARPPATDAG
jgi:transposase